MEQYNIAFIKPPAFEGAFVFREILFLLRNSLVDLGHDCTITANNLSENKINIIVGYHLLKFGDYLDKFHLIPYQLEQLDSDSDWISEDAMQVLHHAGEIWDFSSINISRLEQKDILARHVVPGYHSSLDIVPRETPKDIDVLFYGSINDRRKAVLEELSKHAQVHAVQGAFGPERDDLIARSKIVLNMHYYQSRLLETVRISYLLNNGACVISEDADDDPYPQVSLECIPHDELVSRCLHFLNNDTKRIELAQQNAEQFKNTYPMTSILGAVLK